MLSDEKKANGGRRMEYTALIVEDNQIALESLKRTIPWERLGLRLVATAENGRQGCDLIRQFRPDIVLADIHMPEMDGLAMVALMEEELADSRVIFITAYEKIEYASRAIKLSAFDFILKPLDNEELCQSLRRAAESLHKDRDAAMESERRDAALRRFRFMNALTAGGADRTEMVFLGFASRIPSGYFMICVESSDGVTGPMLQRVDFLDLPEHMELVSAVLDGELVIYCGLAGETAGWQIQARNIAQIISRNCLDQAVAVSGLHTQASELRTAYDEARQTLLRHVIYGRHTTVDFFGSQSVNSTKLTRLVDLEQSCAKMAQKIDSVTPEAVWNMMMEKSGGKLRLVRIMLLSFCTKAMQEKSSISQWTDSVDISVYNITKLGTLDSARSWLDSFFHEVQKINVPANSSLVRNVLEYVREHVTEGLVLESVAAVFYVSPNYLSTLIRKETGITYRQHVINAKMAVAKQMLADTRMRVEDIAYAIGYENYISFYNVFRKVENMSPTEYRFSKCGE